MVWVEAEIMGGAVGVEGDVTPPERRTRDYPGAPATCESWGVSGVDLEELGVWIDREFESELEAIEWIEAYHEEEIREALEAEFMASD